MAVRSMTLSHGCTDHVIVGLNDFLFLEDVPINYHPLKSLRVRESHPQTFEVPLPPLSPPGDITRENTISYICTDLLLTLGILPRPPKFLQRCVILITSPLTWDIPNSSHLCKSPSAYFVVTRKFFFSLQHCSSPNSLNHRRRFTYCTKCLKVCLCLPYPICAPEPRFTFHHIYPAHDNSSFNRQFRSHFFNIPATSGHLSFCPLSSFRNCYDVVEL